MEHTPRVTFGTKLGIIAATAGSAVGLGNIWRFPSQVAQDGGAIFVFIYLACVAFFGIPIVIAEFILGRAGKANSAGAYRNLAPNRKFYLAGYLPIFAAFIISGFYMVVAGWTLEYLSYAIFGKLTPETDFSALFSALLNNASAQIMWMVIFVLGTAGIVAFGVKKGIELASKLMMPLLFIVLIILCIRAVTLPGAGEGLAYLFAPNIENAKSAGTRIFMDALGQSFFSLSVGMGCLMTYASYFGRDIRLVKSASTMAVLDTGVAILAGAIIFPAAFALSTQPETMVETLKAGGPGLVFIAVPQLLQALPGAQLWSILFFLLLVLASLTSTISLLEVITAFIHEEVRITLPKRIRSKASESSVLHQHYKITRQAAVLIISAGIIIIGVCSALSLGENSSLKIFGMTLFDFLDYVTAKLMIPISGIFVSIFTGWYLDKKILAAELTNDGALPLRFFKTYSFTLRYIVPIGIAGVLIYGLI